MIKWHVRFTPESLKALSDQKYIINRFYSLWKLIIFNRGFVYNKKLEKWEYLILESWTIPTTFDLIWTILTTFDLIWTILTTFDLIWTILTTFDLIWPILTIFDLIWTILTTFDLIWTILTTFDLIWTIYQINFL